MLPPFIIDEIRKRERQRPDTRPQPMIELDVPLPPFPRSPSKPQQEDSDRGVVVIDVF